MKFTRNFFTRDVLDIAPELIGQKLCSPAGKFVLTEIEIYRGEEDKACHASKGRTPRTEIMYHDGGHIYVYLIYGMYWMLNIVTGKTNNPQAILIRGIKEVSGPGRVGKFLGIDKSLYGEDITISDRIWIEKGIYNPKYSTTKRIGIDYAGSEWVNKPWRLLLK